VRSTALPADTIVVATDGGCIGNRGADPAGWAWYVDPDNHAYGHLPGSTNNIAELTAVHRVATMLPPEADLLLLVDSRYAIQCLTSKSEGGWVDGWIKRGWKKADGKPVLNREVIQPAYEALQARTGTTRFQWVKGHNGDAMNEAVDKLANKAARSPKVGPLAGPGWTRSGVAPLVLPEPEPTLDVLLGIDPTDPSDQLAAQLVEATEGMIDALIAQRKAAGLKVRDVAERMGIGPAAVQKIETGERDPNLSTLRRYAHAVGAGLQIKVVPTR
jgi:ribonuclease HI